MTKRTLVAFLVCVNLLLLTAIAIVGIRPPAAVAQGTGLGGNYMMVAGEIQDEYDALYMIDLRERTLHAFVFDKGDRQLIYTDYRELERDFRNN